MKKALKVTQSGKNGKSYFYVEKEVLQNDLTTKVVWVRISEQEANEMLAYDHTVADMTFKGDNMTTIYSVNVDTTTNTEAREVEQVLNSANVETIVNVESEIKNISNEIKSLGLMINEAKQAGKSNVMIKYMNQQDILSTKLAELKHELMVLNVKLCKQMK